MIHLKHSKILAFLMAASVAVSTAGTSMTPAFAQQPAAGESVLSLFKTPDVNAGVMGRMWFPDTSSGYDDNDTIATQINALAAAGFGGVEVQLMSDSSVLSNKDLEAAGWGTESFRNMMKKIYQAANAVEGGFKVDITMTAHWPLSIASIDPNDNGASQEISSSMTKITAEDLANGTVDLILPTTKTGDTKLTNASADQVNGQSAYFIFTDTLTDAVLAQVTDVVTTTSTGGGGWPGGPGGGTTTSTSYQLEYATLNNVTGAVEKVTLTADEAAQLDEYSSREIDGAVYAGSAAGIPTAEYAEHYGLTDVTEEKITEWFGPAPAADADLTVSYNGKMDADQNRARLADWQYNYALDLGSLEQPITASEGDDIQIGDWVIVSNFVRGTGQIFSGGKSIMMKNRHYCINYYDASGVDAVTWYWENYVLDDELRQMISENAGGSLFEDSLEVSYSTVGWTYDMKDEFDEFYAPYGGYDYTDLVTAVASSSVSAKTLTGSEKYSIGTTDESQKDEVSGIVSDIKSDVSNMKEHLTVTEHVEVSNAYAHSLGMTYRAQPGTGEAAAYVDIFEADSTSATTLRTGAGVVNASGGEYFSMEGLTAISAFYGFNYEDILTGTYANLSCGVNRVARLRNLCRVWTVRRGPYLPSDLVG